MNDQSLRALYYEKRATLERLALEHDARAYARERGRIEYERHIVRVNKQPKNAAKQANSLALRRLKTGRRVNGLTDSDVKRLRHWEASKRAGRAVRIAEPLPTRPDPGKREPGINAWPVAVVLAQGAALCATIFLGLPLWISLTLVVVFALLGWLAHLTDQVLSETIPASEVEQRKIAWILGPELAALPDPYIEPVRRASGQPCEEAVTQWGDPEQRCVMCGQQHSLADTEAVLDVDSH